MNIDKKEFVERRESHFSDCPRYDKHELTDDQINDIAEKAAIKAVQLAKDGFYKDVGKSIIGRLFWLVGAVTVGLFVWLHQHGFIKL